MMRSGRWTGRLRWGVPMGLATLLLAAGPFVALTRPPADPVVTIINTGREGLVLITDTTGRHLMLGGSEGRSAATALLDRHLPPWDRRLSLLLVPPHPSALPGALEVLERRPVARASLIGLAARPHPALDAWQARHPAPPVVGRAYVTLGGEARLLLDTGPDPAAGAALALVERGPARLLLLFGEAGPLAAEAIGRGSLPAPAMIARLNGRASPAALQPALIITVGEDPGAASNSPRTLALATGESLRVVLQPDRLVVQGESVRALDAP